jgi:hypothetical protein
MISQWIEHAGKQIFYVNLSGFKNDERALESSLKETVNTVGQGMFNQPMHSILILIDLRDTVITRHIQQLINERINDTRQYILKAAVVGLTGIRAVFLDLFGRLSGSETVGFDDLETAKQWLVK